MAHKIDHDHHYSKAQDLYMPGTVFLGFLSGQQKNKSVLLISVSV